MAKKDYEYLLDTPPVLVESEATQAAKDKVTEYESQIPTGDYKGTYSEQVGKLVSDYLGRDKFNYNPNSDSTYQQMRDSYFSTGKKAMQDTLGNATALSGGNNNSSAQVASQQVYQNYAKGVTDAIPTLEQNAYNRYQAEGNQQLQNINLLQNLDDSEFSRYQAKLQNIQNFLNYYYGKYQGEQARDQANFNNEYNLWNTKVNVGQSDYWNQANMDYQIGRDQVADQQNNQTVLQNLGWQKIQVGMRPNKNELSALGMTAAEADKIIANLKAQSVSKGGGSGNSSSGGNRTSPSGGNTTYTASQLQQLADDGKYETLLDKLAETNNSQSKLYSAASKYGLSNFAVDYFNDGKKITTLAQLKDLLKNYPKKNMPSTVSADNVLSESAFYAYGNINSEYNTYADYLTGLYGKYIDL